MATGNLIPAYVIVLEIKRDMATYWMERDRYVNMYTYNRSLLLNSVDVLIGPYIVEFLVTKVFTVVHVASLKSDVYQQLRLTLTW